MARRRQEKKRRLYGQLKFKIETNYGHTIDKAYR